MYKWLSIAAPEDFDALEDELPAEYAPAHVAEKLRAGLTSRVAGVLIEYDYVDKDYRSTYYDYYAKKGRAYRRDCVRLHLFDVSVSAQLNDHGDVVNLSEPGGRLTDHYFGYMVVRPTLHTTIGRALLSPDIRTGATGLAIWAKHSVHLLGHRLEVAGFPWMEQHVDIAVCAHVACWAVLRHYSQRFPTHAEFLMQDITKMAREFDPGGLVPSNGLVMAEAERVFQAAGTFPLLVTRDDEEKWASFYTQLLAYLESGFPLFVGMHDVGHAAVVIGHAFTPAPQPEHANEPVPQAWRLVDHFNVIDDNELPYVSVGGPSKDKVAAEVRSKTPYTADSFDQFIVALPEKIYYSAAAVEELVPTAATELLGFSPGSHIFRYFVTTMSRLRQEVRTYASQYSPEFVQLIMDLPAAQFIWVVEFATAEEWAQRNVSARLILDATAGPSDPNPIWLAHTATNAIVFDRSEADDEGVDLVIGTQHGSPLSAMYLNLRPIVATP